MKNTFRWDHKKNPQESRVQRFYETGISDREDLHNYNQGSLCFGFWIPGVSNYDKAAQALVRRMAQELKLDNQSIILDVGCGMGFQDVIFAREFHPRKIHGIDVARKHIEFARSRIDLYRKEKVISPDITIEFDQGTAVDLKDFGKNVFTHVHALESPEHFDTREKFFQEAFLALMPGGRIACADFILYRQPKNFLERWIVQFGAWVWCVPKANIYDYVELERKLSKIGYRNIRHEFVGAQTIPGYVAWHRRADQRAEMRKLRGFFMGVVGGAIIDWAVLAAYQSGLCEYIIYSAEKPQS